MYSGPEEVIVLSKARPSPDLNIEQLTRAMDELDGRIRKALPYVADIFIDVTSYGGGAGARKGAKKKRPSDEAARDS